MALIELNHVSKTYAVSKRGEGLAGALRGAFTRQKTLVRAVDDISFSIEPGELVGYIGPNGAGKSTTIKLMSGILAPDGGEIRILGRTPWKERIEHVRHIGVVFGQRSQLWWDTPVMDSFDLLRDIYRVDARDYRRRLDDLVGRLEAEPLLHVPVRQLSLGQRMKCELIASLLHEPDILFLDEPTIGLDAVTKLSLRAFLTERNRAGTTMILTTHDMDDIEALSSRVMVIGAGRKLFDGTMGDLRAQYASTRLLKARLARPAERIEIEGADKVALDGQNVQITFRLEAASVQQIIARLNAACAVEDLTVEAQDVERLIALMYREMAL